MATPEPQYPKTADGHPIVPQANAPIELVFIVLALAGVAAGIVALVTTWSQLPASVPMHFGFDGRPNAFGDKTTLVLLPVINLLLVSLLLWIGGRPHLFNYPWKITDENAPRQYRASRVMMRLMAFEVAWLFAYLIFETVRTALGTSQGLSAVFLIVGLLTILGTLVSYIIVALRLR
jgi:uncharacterized membrane protein